MGRCGQLVSNAVDGIEEVRCSWKIKIAPPVGVDGQVRQGIYGERQKERIGQGEIPVSVCESFVSTN